MDRLLTWEGWAMAVEELINRVIIVVALIFPALFILSMILLLIHTASKAGLDERIIVKDKETKSAKKIDMGKTFEYQFSGMMAPSHPGKSRKQVIDKISEEVSRIPDEIMESKVTDDLQDEIDKLLAVYELMERAELKVKKSESEPVKSIEEYRGNSKYGKPIHAVNRAQEIIEQLKEDKEYKKIALLYSKKEITGYIMNRYKCSKNMAYYVYKHFYRNIPVKYCLACDGELQTGDKYCQECGMEQD